MFFRNLTLFRFPTSLDFPTSMHSWRRPRSSRSARWK